MSRTTITLTPEADSLIRKAMKERRLSFREVVNAAIIEGLVSGTGAREEYVLPTFDLGAPRVNLDKALSVAGTLDDDEFIRKYDLGK